MLSWTAALLRVAQTIASLLTGSKKCSRSRSSATRTGWPATRRAPLWATIRIRVETRGTPDSLKSSTMAPSRRAATRQFDRRHHGRAEVFLKRDHARKRGFRLVGRPGGLGPHADDDLAVLSRP